jgi:ribosomal protein S18 acetylase RimI-like enzyme
MLNGMEIRFLTEADAEAYSEIRAEALAGDSYAFGSSVQEHRLLSMQELAARITDSRDKFVCGAFQGSRLIGTAGFFRGRNIKERHKGNIWGVYVGPEFRGKGIARSMMSKLIDRVAGLNDIEQLVLAVGTRQVSAVRLYRSLGFETFGCEKHALKIGSDYIDEEHMVLWLKGQ